MGLHGNIATMSVEDILGWISMGTKTCVLTVNTDVETKRLFFFEGNLIYAQSNIFSERLSGFLMKNNAIKADQVTSIMAEYEGDDRSFGIALMEGGHLSIDLLGTAVRKLCNEIFYSIFAWNNGVFVLAEQEMPWDSIWPVKIPLQNEIMEGARLADEHRLLRSEFAEYKDHQFRLNKENKRALQTRLQTMGPSGQAIFKLMRGRRTLEEIVLLHTEGEAETLTTIKELMDEQLIHPVKRKQRDALEESGDYAQELTSRGDEYLEEGRLNEAILVYEDVLHLLPEHPCRTAMEEAKSQQYERLLRSLGPPKLVPATRTEVVMAEPENLLLTGLLLKVFNGIDGEQTIKQLSLSLGLPIEDVYRAVNRLFEMGYIHFKE